MSGEIAEHLPIERWAVHTFRNAADLEKWLNGRSAVLREKGYELVLCNVAFWPDGEILVIAQQIKR